MALSPADQLSRNRSTSVGDSELPRHEHKRPRLDATLFENPTNPDNVQHDTNMTMDDVKDNSILSNNDNPRSHTPLSRTVSPDGRPNLTSPTSKVTINTRPLSAQSTTVDPTSANLQVKKDVQEKTSLVEEKKSESPVIVDVSDTDSPKNVGGNASEPISIPSSPAESVVIQIGDPEDVDDSTDTTTWSTISGPSTNLNGSRPLDPLHRTVPWLNGNTKQEVQELFQHIVELIEKGNAENFDSFFPQLLVWLTSLPALLSRHTLQTLSEDLEVLCQIPRLLQALLRRRTPLPLVVQDADLIQFFKAFIHTSLYMLELDVQRLVALGDTVTTQAFPVALSLDYFRQLSSILLPSNQSHFYTNLRNHRNIQEKDFSSRIATFIFRDEPQRPFQSLTDLFNEVNRVLPSTSQSRTCLPTIVQHYRTILHVVKLNSAFLTEQQRDKLCKTTHNFVVKTYEALQQAVTKQHPWLNIENNHTCLDAYCRLCMITVMLFPELSEDVFKMARVEPRDIESQDIHDLAHWAFRLTLLRLMILHGRMELRVFSIDAMASDLVNIWTRLNSWPVPRRASLLDLVIDFLRGNDMVRYLLGVDSHPQIVQKSPNVIGFLCVSNQWLPEDTDIAWKAILESHDHRAAAAVVEVLKANVQHLNLESLRYFFEKLSNFPYDHLDARFLEFIIVILTATWQRSNMVDVRDYQINATIVRLCLHLLCIAHVPSRCSSELSQSLNYHIYGFLITDCNHPHIYRVMSLTEEDKTALAETICYDVSSHSDHATGSIIGMTALLSSLDVSAASELITACDFARLLLDDMLHLSTRPLPEISQPEKALFIEFDTRFTCMSYMIINTPNVFNSASYESFWTNVLTSTLPYEIRSQAWNSLAKVYGQVTCLNPFLEFISLQFMDRLPYSALNSPVLTFAKASVNFELKYNLTTLEQTDDCLEIPAMERVWRVMLAAEDDAVENDASDFIINTYLDDKYLLARSAASIECTHAALVDRCIQTVIDSANILKSNQVEDETVSNGGVDNSANLLQRSEAHLHRSLTLLRKFLNGLKSRPRWRLSSPTILAPVLRNFQRRGEAVELALGIVNHPEIGNEKQPWTVGEENTGDELYQFLTNLTGWSQIHFIKGGARLLLQGNESTVHDLKIGPGPVMISKVIGSATTGLSRSVRAASPVDSKVMHHFGELYALLELNERTAKAIFDFLTMFSSQQTIVTQIKSRTVPAQSLLPTDKPFKLLYYVSALRSCIEEESFSSFPDSEFLHYAVRTIVHALEHIQAIDANPSLHTTILLGIMETLLLALRAKVPEATSKAYFQESESFIDRLLQYWSSVQDADDYSDDRTAQKALRRNFFDVIIEITLHDGDLWHALAEDPRLPHILRSAFLADTNYDNRRAILNVILRLTGTGAPKPSLKAQDSRLPRARFAEEKITKSLGELWKVMYPLLPEACTHPVICQEYLEAIVTIFETVSKILDQNSLLETLLALRSLLLRQHDTGQGIYCVDQYLPYGLAKLVSSCVSALQALDVSIPGAVNLARSIFQQFLFPPLSQSETASLTHQNIPIVSSETRTALYDLVASLCQSKSCLEVIAVELEETCIDENAFLPNMSNERRALRSEQGYAGLRNLSNTCYLNSLFCQLFMNIKFRELIIDVNVVDESKQKLVYELASVFANMQSSWEKYVDPEPAVESIYQYTGEQIDVTVQMDVDEFFNLLFDRLEDQITDPDVRQVFKSMYGGQLVQQIKSKECEHVSERLEPFSAVQVEIKGKSGLEDGLAAYVEGEVLQGENKYSCTSCGRHVDAVKRACLKEVPDNLIFNLKRFDYDIMTGTRCKINDEFQFPDKIDMMPYTVDALSEPHKKLPSDMFELVGVIIHSGTAETGHYYSYVRQRPSSRPAEDSWVQFNDHDVSKFELDQMKDLAYGGSEQTFGSLSKFYNGYMLFYQRTSSIKQYAKEYPVVEPSNPVTVLLPQELDNRIAQENEICLRRYIAQDPAHARFVRTIAEQMRPGGATCDKCPDDHALNDRLTEIVLDYIQQVSSRCKEAPEFEATIKLLGEYAKTCSRCAENIVRWFGCQYDRPYDRQRENVLDCILRPFYIVARKNFAGLLSLCYSVLSPLLSADSEEKSKVTQLRRIADTLEAPLRQVSENWKVLQRYNRGWDQLFGMLHSIAQLGQREAVVMIELCYLERVLEIVWIHCNPNTKGTPTEIKIKYSIYLAAREKNRSYNHTAIMSLFADLISWVDLGPARRDARLGTVRTSQTENELFGILDNGSINWIRRMISGRSNPDAAGLVIKELCEYPAFSERLGNVLLQGIEETRSLQIAASFLQPCFIYIRYVSQGTLARSMFTKCVGCVADSEGIYGGDYLDFIREGTEIQECFSDFSGQHAIVIVLDEVEQWVPPLIMAPNDIHRDVRNETLTFLDRILLTQLNSLALDEVRLSDRHMTRIRGLAFGCTKYASKTFLAAQPRVAASQRNTLQAGQQAQAVRLLELCMTWLNNENAEDEQLLAECQTTIDDLNLLAQKAELDNLDEWRDAVSSDNLSEMESFDVSP